MKKTIPAACLLLVVSAVLFSCLSSPERTVSREGNLILISDPGNKGYLSSDQKVITLTFSKPMLPHTDFTTNFYLDEHKWSSNYTVLSIYIKNRDKLPSGMHGLIVLNPDGGGNMGSEDGEKIEADTAITFTVR